MLGRPEFRALGLPFATPGGCLSGRLRLEFGSRGVFGQLRLSQGLLEADLEDFELAVALGHVDLGSSSPTSLLMSASGDGRGDGDSALFGVGFVLADDPCR